jgi:hypothetical protein
MRAGVRVGNARALAPQRRLLAGREAGGLHAACFARKLSACPPWSPRPAFRGGGGVTKTCIKANFLHEKQSQKQLPTTTQ